MAIFTWGLGPIARIGAAVAERLACSPPTKSSRVQSPAAYSRIFARGNPAGRGRWSAGFLGNLPFFPSFNSGIVPYSPQSLSSALKTLLLRAAQISSLTIARKPIVLEVQVVLAVGVVVVVLEVQVVLAVGVVVVVVEVQVVLAVGVVVVVLEVQVVIAVGVVVVVLEVQVVIAVGVVVVVPEVQVVIVVGVVVVVPEVQEENNAGDMKTLCWFLRGDLMLSHTDATCRLTRVVCRSSYKLLCFQKMVAPNSTVYDTKSSDEESETKPEECTHSRLQTRDGEYFPYLLSVTGIEKDQKVVERIQLPGGYALHRGSGKYQRSANTGIREQGELVEQSGQAYSSPITGILNNRYQQQVSTGNRKRFLRNTASKAPTHDGNVDCRFVDGPRTMPGAVLGRCCFPIGPLAGAELVRALHPADSLAHHSLGRWYRRSPLTATWVGRLNGPGHSSPGLEGFCVFGGRGPGGGGKLPAPRTVDCVSNHPAQQEEKRRHPSFQLGSLSVDTKLS
ncbi:hypothetical protein PR048_026350 [Dryococelus australis]|uniref:Uncharacterized protein n=1 Tax=Dryococelus australis TaxID=614101 RepID=A0ABQ9GL37_9NEOP|nr:hypothetical protein PR048_026350 [Dryococelus australis]